ncbi:hypothetical protein NS206_01540 [Microbacterium testaceum]|jgi:hypothetical protein|nr:hypothetical protein NS206_01540 [Microbacterium testaceum]
MKTTSPRKSRVLTAIGAAVAATSLGLVGAAAPALADTTAVNQLADTTSVQSTSNNMSFVDSGGETFQMDVTTTWQRASSSQAELRSIVVRAGDFPRGDCINLDVSSTGEIGFQSLGNLLCPGETVTLAANVQANATTGNNLGQLTLSAPDPYGDGGARWMYIEFHG